MRRAVVFASLVLLPVSGGLAGGEACPGAQPGEAARLAAYVAKKYHVPAEARLRVEGVEPVGEACYHKVTFRGDGALGAYQLILYASPDFRFLSSDMLDTRRDPREEERETAACAGFQNAGAFWAMHDALFAEHGELTAANVDGKVREMAAGIPGLGVAAFGVCLERQMSLGAVIRDRELGTRLGVTGTPAVFVNGRRVEGIRDGAGLHAAIRGACGAVGRCG